MDVFKKKSFIQYFTKNLRKQCFNETLKLTTYVRNMVILYHTKRTLRQLVFMDSLINKTTS